jgi:hypothetical protein
MSIVACNFGVTLYAIQQDDVELSTLLETLSLARGQNFAEGELTEEVNLIFDDSRTLSDGANEVLNLHNGSLTNKLNQAITMDILKAIYIKNTSVDAGLIVGGGTTPVPLFSDASDKVIVKPGGTLLLIAPNVVGWDITANCLLKLEHDGVGSSTLTYELVVAGVDPA